MEMTWVSVKDRLPEVPDGKYGISVLVVTYDHIYAEISGGNGYEIYQVSFGKVYWSNNPDFYQLCDEGEYPTGDPVKYWMYLPEPPTEG